MHESAAVTLAYDDIANKIGLSLTIGLLVGLEREWAQKEVGVRTFAIIALLGTLASMASHGVIVVSLMGVLLTAIFVNVQSFFRDRSLELTTSAAMMVMLVLGVLVGQGMYFAAATSAILLTMLLAWKVELARFADALHPEEIRGAVLLGLLTFVIYPLLPNRFIDPMHLVNPRQAWVTVVAIAFIGFVNYVLLRIYSTRGLYYAAILGGMVNSTAAVAELSASFRSQMSGLAAHAVSLFLLTNVSMFIRNFVILGVFAAPSVLTAALSLGCMAAISLLFVWLRHQQQDPTEEQAQPLQLASPVSLKRVLKFGVLFVCLASAGTLAQRYFGNLGFMLVSILGGVISSASTAASAAALASSSQISFAAAGYATVLTSMSSALVNMPLVYQQTRDRNITRRLTLATLIVVAVGLVVLGATVWLDNAGYFAAERWRGGSRSELQRLLRPPES